MRRLMRSFAESERDMPEQTAPATATILEKVMSKYTAEQVEHVVDVLLDQWDTTVVIAMLRDYAAFLRERESAKAAVTDEMVDIATAAYMHANDELPRNRPVEDLMRAALEAVAPMLASARVPDAIKDDDPRQFLGWSTTDIAYRAGWNQCRKAMLATDPKPEKE